MRSSLFLAGLLCGFLLAIGLTSKAQLSLSIFGLSKHSTPNTFCEYNPGWGLSYGLNEDWRLTAVKYKNSLCRESDAYGAVYTPFKLGRFELGTAILRITGYSDSAMYVPIPVISYRGNGYAIDAIVVAKPTGGVIGVGLRVPLRW